MRVVRELSVAFLLTVTLCGCQSHNYMRPGYAHQGATMGGLGGAGIGALIGEAAADEPLAGAAIGSVVGALSGAAVGSGLDEVTHRQQVAQAAYAQSGTSLDEIVAMANAGLGDQIINRHIRTHGFSGQLDAVDLIALRQQGVSDAVIQQLQDLGRPTSVAQAQHVVDVPVGGPHVIVEERYQPVPVPVFPRPVRRPCPPYRRGPRGLQWGIAISN